MHYKMIIEDYPQELALPTRQLLEGKRYHYTGYMLEDRLVWDFFIYSIRERKRIALDILYSEYTIHSIVITDDALLNAGLPGWQYIR
jgi:hypothetical protein